MSKKIFSVSYILLTQHHLKCFFSSLSFFPKSNNNELSEINFKDEKYGSENNNYRDMDLLIEKKLNMIKILI